MTNSEAPARSSLSLAAFIAASAPAPAPVPLTLVLAEVGPCEWGCGAPAQVPCEPYCYGALSDEPSPFWVV